MTACELSEDFFLGGGLRLRQPVSGHRAGHDAMLLAAATPARAGDRVVEFGAGVGAAGLAVTRRIGGCELVLVERDPGLASLANDNASRNEIAASVVVLDVTGANDGFMQAGLGPDSADVVLMNPPFNDSARHQPSPDPTRANAHVAAASTLEGWVHGARRILKPGGRLTLIWRAEGLGDVLAALARGFGGVEIAPVHGAAGKPAIRVLVGAVKGGRAPLRLHPGLMLNDESGVPNQVAVDILAGRAVLPLAWP